MVDILEELGAYKDLLKNMKENGLLEPEELEVLREVGLL